MAEGLGKEEMHKTKAFKHVESAALEGLKEVNPLAIQALGEIGIDITSNHSKLIDQFKCDNFDIVISMCGCSASVPEIWKENKRFEDWNIDDPSGHPFEKFIECRNEIQARVRELAASIQEKRLPKYSLYISTDACELKK